MGLYELYYYLFLLYRVLQSAWYDLWLSLRQNRSLEILVALTGSVASFHLGRLWGMISS
jgi:hypothetical protein